MRAMMSRFGPEAGLWAEKIFVGTIFILIAKFMRVVALLCLSLLAFSAPALATAPEKRVDQLIAELHSADPEVRQWAALGLGRPNADSDAAIEALLGALRDGNSSIRLFARDSLMHQGAKASAALAAYDHARLARLERQLSLPDYETLEGLLIILKRSSCAETADRIHPFIRDCPDYEVRLHGDGALLYKGWRGVKTPGDKLELVDYETLKQLLIEFRKASFFSLNDSFEEAPTDERIETGDVMGYPRPTVSLTLILDGERKVVNHYLGDKSAPQALTDLEEAVDRILGTDRWTR